MSINGLIRIQSRPDLHEFYPELFRKPIILPEKTSITEHIVLTIHKKHSHSGPETRLPETKL